MGGGRRVSSVGRTLYDELGVDKKSSPEEITKSFKKLALRFHPDKNPNPDAVEKFKDINRVYHILHDPSKREIYDKYGSLGLKIAEQQGIENINDIGLKFQIWIKLTWVRVLLIIFGILTIGYCFCCCFCFCCCCLRKSKNKDNEDVHQFPHPHDLEEIGEGGGGGDMQEIPEEDEFDINTSNTEESANEGNGNDNLENHRQSRGADNLAFSIVSEK